MKLIAKDLFLSLQAAFKINNAVCCVPARFTPSSARVMLSIVELLRVLCLHLDGENICQTNTSYVKTEIHCVILFIKRFERGFDKIDRFLRRSINQHKQHLGVTDGRTSWAL